MSSFPPFEQEPHNKWEKITVHTAKCDRCGRHNTKVLQRCNLCNKQYCKECIKHCTESMPHQAPHVVNFDQLDWSEATPTPRRQRQPRTPRRPRGPIVLGGNPTKITKTTPRKGRRQEPPVARYQEVAYESNNEEDEDESLRVNEPRHVRFYESSSPVRRPGGLSGARENTQQIPRRRANNGVLPAPDYSYNPASEPQMTDYYPANRQTRVGRSIGRSSHSAYASSYESPGSFERPTSYESTSLAERSTSYESPGLFERTTSYESPRLAERPTLYESPRLVEHPTSHESPRLAERLTSYESPSLVERATPHESPSLSERQTLHESPRPSQQIPARQQSRQERINELMEEFQTVPQLVAILEAGDLEEAESYVEAVEALMKQNNESD